MPAVPGAVPSTVPEVRKPRILVLPAGLGAPLGAWWAPPLPLVGRPFAVVGHLPLVGWSAAGELAGVLETADVVVRAVAAVLAGSPPSLPRAPRTGFGLDRPDVGVGGEVPR
jgi:hypothetical protein